ncbi:MAG: glycoside hydrolase family 105 protein [Candidatus Acidiferrales bacterium]
MKKVWIVLCALLAMGTVVSATAGATKIKSFQKWPAGASPQEIGTRVAERFIASPHLGYGRPGAPRPIIYPEVITWYGALTFAQLTGNKDMSSRLAARFAPLFTTDANLIPDPVNVDFTVFGSIPFELYIETGDQKYLNLGLHFADSQWANPQPDGLTNQTRYWIDDMYMITLVEVQAYRATHDSKYLDRAAMEMSAYLDKLQEPNGLFYHAPDVPFFWGRGNGWVAAGMAELLSSMPADHPQRAKIMAGYQKMMAALLKVQGKDGLWKQLIDHPEAWSETSCTGMFTFAMITGVKNGWLDPKIYGAAARKGWLGLVSKINADGDISDVCAGTNKKNDLDYYLTRPRNTGDMHGQGPILWSASAFLR